MMGEWAKAGGMRSPLGARKGDVYPAGEGFALNFDSGKMFYAKRTGARFVYGPILDKYESLGGPADSDLGFPASNEVPGLAGPDSRVTIFSAADKPVIFWTPDHGAFVVRGALNAAWDKLGSSGGDLGIPVGDQTFEGDVTSQRFSGGEIAWNRNTSAFTTKPTGLGDRLAGLQVPPNDPTMAIKLAWRAAGGSSGPLGAVRGEQYPLGGDGIVQDFDGGKVFFSPRTGANAVGSDMLAKYESLGGPGGDLGFPTANESDGGIPSSRICSFSAADNPVIFWTAEHGAFVVRGAIKTAWDKLRGPAGRLGAPVGDQAVSGDAVSQKFAGGKISWDRAKNIFATEPANLAPLLAGLHVPGQDRPSGSVGVAHPRTTSFSWPSWYLLALIPLLALAALAALAVAVRRRRRPWGANYYRPVHEFGPAEHLEFDPRPSVPAGRYSSAAEPAPGKADPDVLDTDSIPVVSKPVREAGATTPAPPPGPARRSGRHAAVDTDDEPAHAHGAAATGPTIHLPLGDPYQVPAGYPIKASTRSGLYYTPESELYQDTIAELWLSSEEVALANGFKKVD